MSFRIVRAGSGYRVILAVTPADAKEGEGTYYELNPGRQVPGWKEGFNQVSWENDARYLFSGQADGLGFAEVPSETFPSLEAITEFIKTKKERK